MIRVLLLPIALVLLPILAGPAQVAAAEPTHTPHDETNKSPSSPDSKLPAQNITVQNFTVQNFTVQNIDGLWASTRIVNDLAKFDLASLSSNTAGAQIVARIHPGGLSGSGYYSPETGVVVRVGGQWTLIEVLGGKAPPCKGRFQWQEPQFNHFDRNRSLLDMTSVFTNPNIDSTVICQFLADKSGAEQFAQVTSIPADWKAFVKPAHEHYLRQAADFTGNDLNEFRKLALSENPFLSLKAIDHLVRNSTNEKEIDALVDLTCSLPRYQQAVLIVALLNRKEDHSPKIASKAIDRAKDSAELTGMALGVFAWSASQGRNVTHTEPTQELLETVQQKWRSFDSSIPDDWTGSLNKILLEPDPRQK